MRGPKPPIIELTRSERSELNSLLRRHSTPQQLALRARIVLAAADGLNNGQIVRQLGVSRDMVRLWRGRWLGLAAVPFEELSAEAVCQIVALACEAPAESGRPISQWSSREIADEVLRREQP